MQSRASTWSLGLAVLSYKRRLSALKLLSLSMYFEFLELLSLMLVIVGKYSIDTCKPYQSLQVRELVRQQ